jgi:hypothetical protein
MVWFLVSFLWFNYHMYSASSIYQNETYETPTEALSSLADAVVTKRYEQTQGSAPPREENWLHLVTRLDKEKGLGIFEKPSYAGFSRLMSHLEVEYIPHLIHEASAKRGLDVEKAFKEAHETAFLARQRVVDHFTHDENIPESDRVHILMQHFLMSELEIQDGVFSGSRVDRISSIRNEMFSALVDYGIDSGREFDSLINTTRELQAKQFTKMREYARQYDEDVRDGRRNYGTTFQRNFAHPFTRHSEETQKIVNGMKGEIYSAWILRHMVVGLGLEVCKASSEADITNEGDFFIVKDNGPADADLDVVFAVDAKNIQGYEPEFQVRTPDGQIFGRINPSKAPNAAMVEKARENGTMLIVLRNPINRVNVDVEGFQDPKSFPASTGNQIRNALKGSEVHLG